MNDAVKVEIMKNARYILSAQKYAGISAEITHPGKVKVLFETSYRGNFIFYSAMEQNSYCILFTFRKIPDYIYMGITYS